MRLIALLLTATFSLPAVALTFTTEDFPPFNFSPDGGKTVSGSATDILREAMKRTGLQASISLMPWERAYKMGQDDKNTCVFSTTRTEAREPLFKWVGPLVDNNWIIFAKSDSPIAGKALDDVKQYKIGGYRGDAAALFLKEKNMKVEEADNDDQNVRKLGAGRIDRWIAGSLAGPWIAKKAGVPIKPLFTVKETQMYLACNKGVADDVTKKLNDAIKAIRSDGTAEKIYKSY